MATGAQKIASAPAGSGVTAAYHAKSSKTGGKRPGAGRPKGALTKRTREITEQAMAEGITPLEVILRAMRETYEKEGAAAAVPFAAQAAPYCHPRLQTIQASGPNGGAIKMDLTLSPDEAWFEMLKVRP